MPAKPKLLFPSALVSRARQNPHLQGLYQLVDAQARYRDVARACPACGCGGSSLAWIYYRSEAWTWHAGCGTGGWLTVCDACDAQIDYFLEEISEHGRPDPILVHSPQPA